MPAQQWAVTCQGYPEIKPRDISEKALPGHPPPSHKQGEIYALLRPCSRDRLSGCQSLLGLVLASADGWWEGAVCPASCTRIAIPFAFPPLLRTCVSEHPGVRGFISCWKLFQEFQEKSMVWGPAGWKWLLECDLKCLHKDWCHKSGLSLLLALESGDSQVCVCWNWAANH